MRVRRIALDTFGEHRVKFGRPLAELEEPLVTTYLFHRFQLESTASVLGGLYYHYKVRGDVQDYPQIVPADIQKSGLEALLETISPHTLEIPKSLRDLMHPRPQHLEQTRDLFPGRTGLTFDPMAAAETAASMTLSLILHPERAARLVEFSARDPRLPGLSLVIDRLLESTWLKIQENPYHQELQRLVNYLVLYYMVELVKDKNVPAIVSSLAFYKLKNLSEKVMEFETEDESQVSQYFYLNTLVERLEEDPNSVDLTPPVEVPMGAPI
jgi:hypothetical protein